MLFQYNLAEFFLLNKQNYDSAASTYLDFIESIKAIKEMEKNARSDDDFLNLYNNYTTFYGKLDDHDMQAY